MKQFVLTLLLSFLSLFSLQANDLERGYRGFVESESFFFPDIGFLGGHPGSSDFWTGVSTTHGYQFNPHLFVGGGMSCIWLLNDKDYRTDKPKVMYLPLFADVRTDLRFGRFTPFFDFRVGYNLLHKGFFSGALTVGYRFSWGRRVALNLALGANFRGIRNEGFIEGWDEETGPWLYPTGKDMIGCDVKPVVRLGIEF